MPFHLSLSAAGPTLLPGSCMPAHGQLRLTSGPQHVHAARLGHRLGRQQRPIAAAAAAAAPRRGASCGGGAAAAAGGVPRSSRRAPAAASSSQHSNSAAGLDEDEVVDAIAVLERPGAVPNTQFEQHDQARELCDQLMIFNSQLGAAIQSADTVLEQSEWDTLTLPVEVKKDWVEVFRSSRKEQERARKEERRRRKEEREQLRAASSSQQQQQEQEPAAQPAAADAMPAVAHQPPLTQQQPQQQSLQQQQPPPPLRLQQQPVAQHMPQQQQQQPAPRTRRQRSSAGRAAPAAVSSSVLSSLGDISPKSSSSSSSVGGVRTAASSAAVSAAPTVPAATSAAPVAPVAGSTAAAPAAKPRRTRAAGTAPALASPDSSSTALAVPSPVQQQQQQPVLGFAPLPVLQQHRPVAAPVRSAGAATSRRLQRAAGMGQQRGSRVTAAGAAAAPTAAAKLADNTIHGLDMRAELLTGDQEKELAVMVQDLIALETVAKDLAAKLGRTPSDIEWMEAAAAAGVVSQSSAGDASGDVEAALTSFQARLHAGRSAKQVMIKANYKLVVSICRKYSGAALNMGDLINEGIAGLVKGVEKFEPAKGFKFSTYAHWWIRQSISRSLADQGRLVRLPIHMQELLGRATKASKAFEAKHGREATAEELAPELGVDASRIKDAWEAVINPRSLDQPMGDAEGGTLGDVVEDDRTIGSEEAVYMESLKQDLEGVLAGLSARDAGVLRMRFGLQDGKEYTLDEVGAEFKVTRERIRQIEAKAIRQLRAHHVNPGSAMADYQFGPMSDKQLASRTSSGTKRQK